MTFPFPQFVPGWPGPMNGLIHRYPMNATTTTTSTGNIRDAVGTINATAASSITFVTGPSGSSSSGISFTGGNYATFGSDPFNGTGSRSLGIWFNTASTARMAFCGNVDLSGNFGLGFGINRTAAGHIYYQHQNITMTDLADSVGTGAWFHAAVTYDTTSATVTLYVNGAQIGSPATSIAAMAAADYAGKIADSSDGTSFPYTGSLAQFVIYNRALTSSEITQLYAAF